METLAVANHFSPSRHRRIPKLSFNAVGRSSVAAFRSRYSFSAPAIKCSAVSTPPSVALEDAVKFTEASKNGNVVPLYRCIFCDHLTPVLAYRCLVKEDDREAPSFLFESVDQVSGTSNVGRYSVVGAQPTMEIVAKENSVTIMDHKEGKRIEQFVDDPMGIPRKIMEDWHPQLIDDLPDAFCGNTVVD